MDVHDATISVAVKNAEGKLLMECVLETKAATILDFIQGLQLNMAAFYLHAQQLAKNLNFTNRQFGIGKQGYFAG